MNKKLLALAIGAAVAMPVAALADGPTLYGKINLSLESAELTNDIGAPIAEYDQWNVENNASRIGVKGSAETGVDGLKGVYLAEFGVDADDGASPFTSRNIYAGLAGDFGTALIGNIDSPLKTSQGNVDQFNDTSLDMASYVAGELRAPNVVAYVSPKLADAVTVTAAVWQGEGAVVDGEPLEGIGDAVSASVVYDKEGLYLALAMDKETPVTSGAVATAVEVAGGSVAGVINDITRLVATYSTDSFEVGGLYSVGEVANEGADLEETTLMLSGAYKTGDWKFKAQYAQATAEGNDLPAPSDEADLTAYAIGADYALGKATTVGAYYGSSSIEIDGLSGSIDTTVLGFNLEQRF